MKKTKISVLAVIMATSMLCSSCIGPFKLTKQLWDWNGNICGKVVNELVFLAMHLIPVYPVAYLADALIFNTIDFWTTGGAFVSTEVKGENGTYLVEGTENGYKVTNTEEGESVNFVLNTETKTWSIEANGESVEFMTIVDENNVVMHVGETDMQVELSQAGAMAFRQAVENVAFFAMK